MITNFDTNPSSELRHFTRNGSIYFELSFQCPVCLQNGINNVPVTYWYHDSCEAPHGYTNRIFIGDDGNYICEYCEHSEVIVLWDYYCPVHDTASVNSSMRDVGAKRLSKIVAAVGMLVDEAGDDWLIKVLTRIREQFSDPKYQ